jgi:hypothetical protein
LIDNLDREIYYYYHVGELFINCGIDPINDEIKIFEDEYLSQDYLIIKLKNIGVSMVHRLLSFEQEVQKAD